MLRLLSSLMSTIVQAKQLKTNPPQSPAYNFILVPMVIALTAILPIIFPPESNALNSAPTLEVCFTPGDNCTDHIVSALNGARHSIFVQAYSFTSPPIAEALRAAHKRGVRVTVILDKSQVSERYSSADFLARAGIPTFIDTKHAIAHNKIILIDKETILTGSFNFTRSAQNRNAENLLTINGDPELREQYNNNFSRHEEHSQPYTPR